MATSYNQSSGFSLPGIDFSLTKPVDLVGAIGTGMQLGNAVLDIPNQNRQRKLVTQQQENVLGGNLALSEMKVGADGGVTSAYEDPEKRKLEMALAGYKAQTEQARAANLGNQMSNRDANTQSMIGSRDALTGLRQDEFDQIKLPMSEARIDATKAGADKSRATTPGQNFNVYGADGQVGTATTLGGVTYFNPKTDATQAFESAAKEHAPVQGIIPGDEFEDDDGPGVLPPKK